MKSITKQHQTHSVLSQLCWKTEKAPKQPFPKYFNRIQFSLLSTTFWYFEKSPSSFFNSKSIYLLTQRRYQANVCALLSVLPYNVRMTRYARACLGRQGNSSNFDMPSDLLRRIGFLSCCWRLWFDFVLEDFKQQPDFLSSVWETFLLLFITSVPSFSRPISNNPTFLKWRSRFNRRAAQLTIYFDKTVFRSDKSVSKPRESNLFLMNSFYQLYEDKKYDETNVCMT